jgi:hypothetical protein
MVMTKFFNDEPEEPKLPTVAFEFKAPDIGRKRTMTLAARRRQPFSLSESVPPPKPPPTPEARPSVDETPPAEEASDPRQYTSSLFL